jgi:hypothetical protein
MTREKFQLNHDRQKSFDHKWRKGNKERNCELVKEWYRRNPDRIKTIRDRAQAK